MRHDLLLQTSRQGLSEQPSNTPGAKNVVTAAAHASAARRDRVTAEAIERLEAAATGPYAASGFRSLRGRLALGCRRGPAVERLDLRNSGDTAGDRRSVVGAWAFSTPGGGDPPAG